MLNPRRLYIKKNLYIHRETSFSAIMLIKVSNVKTAMRLLMRSWLPMTPKALSVQILVHSFGSESESKDD